MAPYKALHIRAVDRPTKVRALETRNTTKEQNTTTKIARHIANMLNEIDITISDKTKIISNGPIVR